MAGITPRASDMSVIIINVNGLDLSKRSSLSGWLNASAVALYQRDGGTRVKGRRENRLV